MRLANETLGEWVIESSTQTTTPINRSQFTTLAKEIIDIGIKTNAVGSDGISVAMLRLCCPYVLPIITHIINSCLLCCVFPNQWKTANVIPLPKTSEPKSYMDLRPISILPVMSKILEKVMVEQIISHITFYNILPETQSGFRKGYSCATALLNITDDILSAADKDKTSVVVLLDYSKAFDTISHKILFSTLRFIGFGESAVELMQSYLTNRFQKVILKGKTSTPLPIMAGVPQGSNLGPILYSLYTCNFKNYVEHCRYHLYADDTQLQLDFNPEHVILANHQINTDIDNLVKISEKHCLRINAEKSVVMVFGKSKARNLIKNDVIIKVGDKVLPVKETAKNLGLIFDEDLRFSQHISHILRKAYINLKLIFHQRFCLNRKLKLLLCESLVLSHFNYCDVVYGPCLDSHDVKRIQRMQNSCLRLIYGIRKFDHISHKLTDANWLNMSNRRILHASILFHKIIITKQPSYLFNKIKFRYNIHNVNVRNKTLITPPIHKSQLFERSFSYNISSVYNSLPEVLKPLTASIFRNRLVRIIFENQ